MSDYLFVHPKAPSQRKGATMSDYIPNPPPERDPRNYDPYYEPAGGKGLTLVVGILVAIALVAGLMFFSGRHRENTELAQQPDRTLSLPTDQSRTQAIPPATPAPAPANPAPTTPRQ
jgi:hypothetical protein